MRTSRRCRRGRPKTTPTPSDTLWHKPDDPAQTSAHAPCDVFVPERAPARRRARINRKSHSIHAGSDRSRDTPLRRASSPRSVRNPRNIRKKLARDHPPSRCAARPSIPRRSAPRRRPSLRIRFTRSRLSVFSDQSEQSVSRSTIGSCATRANGRRRQSDSCRRYRLIASDRWQKKKFKIF